MHMAQTQIAARRLPAEYTVMTDVRDIQNLTSDIRGGIIYRDAEGWECKLERCSTGGFVPEGAVLKRGVKIDRTSVVFSSVELLMGMKVVNVHEGAKIINSVVGRDVKVGYMSLVRCSQIGKGTSIGYNSKINFSRVFDGVIIGDNVSVGRRNSTNLTWLSSKCALLDGSSVGDGCYLGKLVVYPGVTIGHDSNIGDGHNIEKNVPPFTVRLDILVDVRRDGQSEA